MRQAIFRFGDLGIWNTEATLKLILNVRFHFWFQKAPIIYKALLVDVSYIWSAMLSVDFYSSIVPWAFFVTGINTWTFFGPRGSIFPRKWKSAVFSDNLYFVSLRWIPESCNQWTMPSSFIKISLKPVISVKNHNITTLFDLRETLKIIKSNPLSSQIKKWGSERGNLSEVTQLTSNTEWELESSSPNF